MSHPSSLPPHAYLDPECFVTEFDRRGMNVEYGRIQYERGLRYGREALCVSISQTGAWSAQLLDGASVTSFEVIGYHARTAELLRGFLDSGVKIVVYRWPGMLSTSTIVQLSRRGRDLGEHAQMMLRIVGDAARELGAAQSDPDFASEEAEDEFMDSED